MEGRGAGGRVASGLCRTVHSPDGALSERCTLRAMHCPERQISPGGVLGRTVARCEAAAQKITPRRTGSRTSVCSSPTTRAGSNSKNKEVSRKSQTFPIPK